MHTQNVPVSPNYLMHTTTDVTYGDRGNFVLEDIHTLVMDGHKKDISLWVMRCSQHSLLLAGTQPNETEKPSLAHLMSTMHQIIKTQPPHHTKIKPYYM